MSLRIAMAVQGARMLDETRERVTFEHQRYGVPILFVETGSVLSRTVRTTVHARFLTPAGPVFQIRHRSFPLRASLRRRNLETLGDFRVQSPRPGSTHALIGARGASILHDLGRDASLASDGAQITLTLAGQIGAKQVAPVTELMVAMGQADIFGLSELRALPGAVYHPPQGSYAERTRPWVEVHAPTRVDLAPVAVAGVAQTWAGRAYDHGVPFSVQVDGAGAKIPEVTLADNIRRHIDEVGSGQLSAREGALTFTWAGVETDRARLMAGVRLLASFPAVHAAGVYR